MPNRRPGELYIGGGGVTQGYFGQEELTKERFIPNPFAKEVGLPKSDRIYKTGDLVRWLPDGNIEYLGRTDFQVKIRGFRIELGEIENTLAQHSAISQVTVIDKDKEGQKYLAAYYIVGKDKEAPEVEGLRAHLLEKLPDYMVPAAFVKLDEMPLTPNGKINRKAFPDPDMSLMEEEYVAPRNEIEAQLAQIWCDILKLEQIGIHDNFFRIGGHSLLSVQLVSSVNEAFDLSVMVSWAFAKTTIAEQALSIEKDRFDLKEYQPMLKLKAFKGETPLFLVHPGSGGAEVYSDLSNVINQDQPLMSALYGVESYNLYNLDQPITHMALLAAKYIEYIKSIQHQGPYFIGGWSLGGTLSYEVARQLKDNGDRVLGVYLIDSVVLGPEVGKKLEAMFSRDYFIAQLKRWKCPMHISRDC